MRRPRGITIVTVLIFLAVGAGVYWIYAFGQAYWDNFEVNGILRQAANECYRQPDDEKVRAFISARLTETLAKEGEDRYGRRETRLPFDFDMGDIQIERNQVPRYVNIWFTYQRKVRLPLVKQDRTLTFSDHAQQDLSPVKW